MEKQSELSFSAEPLKAGFDADAPASTVVDTLVLANESLAQRGPRMARYGFMVVVLLAAMGLSLNLTFPGPFARVGVPFYSVEFVFALALTAISFTQWFQARWEAIVLVAGYLLLTAMTISTLSAGTFLFITMGLLLLDMGTAAFLPWRPWHQLIFTMGTLASAATYTIVSSHLEREMVAYWVVLVMGGVIAQVASVAAYHFRLELGRRLESVVAGRERLAEEVREREKVISTLRETQKELVVSREAALAASRSRSEFLSSMSHEIRTPMNSVLGMAELLGETRLDGEQRRYLSLIQSNGETLLELINSILDLARMESGRLRPARGEFDLREMIEQLLDALAVAAFEKQIELVGRINPEVPRRVVGDAFRLRQVLTNLIGNAIKFTERGQVVVTVAHDPRFHLPGAIKFTVADSGIGIPRDKLKMIFEPFTQADSSSARGYGGSGLGLAIATRLVGLMHGTLAADSEVGKGSTFSFTVPFETVAGAEAAAQDVSLRGISAIVIDDNAEARGALCGMLSQMGAKADQCGSGREAIARLREGAREQHAIVLVDRSMPDLALPDLVDALRASAIDPSRVIMMLRTTELTTDLADLRAAGLNAYLTKPIKLAELAAVARSVTGRMPASGAPSKTQAVADVEVGLKHPARILIADDVTVNRTLIHDMLRHLPFAIDDALDGKDALTKVMTGNYDLVLMDMQMPVLDGYDAASAIRKWEREQGRTRLPIIALTASVLEADIKRAVEAGCDVHLAKPFRRKELVQLLGELLRESQQPLPLEDDKGGKRAASCG